MPKHRHAGDPRQRLNSAISTGLPVSFVQQKNCGRLQQAVIAVLVKALDAENVGLLNYDHVTLAVPKSPVPINYRKHRYDVALAVGDRVILIDVLNVDALYWKQGEVTEHGEGEVETI